MYSVAQPIQNAYDSTPQFQTWQPSAMQMLSDVTIPDEPTSVPGPLGLQHNGSSGSSNLYQQQQVPQSLIQKGYAHGIAMGGMPQPEPEIMEGEDFRGHGPGMEAAYNAYQTALKEIFQNIINGRLADASSSLLDVSEWLLGHIGELGKLHFFCLTLPTKSF
jgi:hypothetical protein